MHSLLTFVIGSTLLIGALLLTGYFKTEPVRESELAPAELHRYRSFTEAVDRFVKANPAYAGTVTWSTLKDEASTPTALRGASMPVSFKAVVQSGQFVVCGELSQAALAALVREMPEDQQGTGVAEGGAQFHVLGPSTLDYASEAAKCE